MMGLRSGRVALLKSRRLSDISQLSSGILSVESLGGYRLNGNALHALASFACVAERHRGI